MDHGGQIEIHLETHVLAAVNIEETLHHLPSDIALPQELLEWWTSTSEVGIFVDVNYGQGGLILWPLDAALVYTKKWIVDRPEQYDAGDLVIGEFLGDSDLLVMCCDKSSPNFGHLLVALPLDSREDWYLLKFSLGQFIEKLLTVEGEKYWEP